MAGAGMEIAGIIEPSMFVNTIEDQSRYIRWHTLRAMGVIADLVHDFGRNYLDGLFGPYPESAVGGAGGQPHPLSLLINRLTRNLDAQPNITVIRQTLQTFYTNCRNDATSKSLYTQNLNNYLSLYENINSMETYVDKEYDNENESGPFFNMLNTAGGSSNPLSFFLDAQFGNVLKEYRDYKNSPSINNRTRDEYLKDVAYIIDPASGWDPKGTYTEDFRRINRRFDSTYTGLGYDLILEYGNENTATAYWARDGSSPIVITSRTNSVNETATECLRLRDAGTNWEMIIDVLLLKTAGDITQGFSMSSTLWVGKNVVGVSNDYLAVLYFLLFKRAWVLFTGSGYYKLYMPSALTMTLSADENANLRALIPAGTEDANITSRFTRNMAQAQAHIVHITGIYIGGNIPEYTKVSLTAGASLPAESVISINSNIETYSCGVGGVGIEIGSILAHAVTFVCDILEKKYIYGEMENKRNSNIFKAAEIAAGGPLSRIYLPLTSEYEFRKYMDLYSIFTKKASIGKFRAAFQLFWKDLERPVTRIGPVIVINSSNPRFILYRELKRIFSNVIKSDVITASAVAFILTYYIYGATNKTVTVSGRERGDEAMRKRRQQEDSDARLEWLGRHNSLYTPFATSREDIRPNLINIIGTIYPDMPGSTPVVFDPTLNTIFTDNVLLDGTDIGGVTVYESSLERSQTTGERKVISRPIGMIRGRGKTKVFKSLELSKKVVSKPVVTQKKLLTIPIKKKKQIGGAGEDNDEIDAEENPANSPDLYALHNVYDAVDLFLDSTTNNSETLATLIADTILSATVLDTNANGLEILTAVGNFTSRFENETGVPLQDLATEMLDNYAVAAIRPHLLYRLDELKERISTAVPAVEETVPAVSSSAPELTFEEQNAALAANIAEASASGNRATMFKKSAERRALREGRSVEQSPTYIEQPKKGIVTIHNYKKPNTSESIVGSNITVTSSTSGSVTSTPKRGGARRTRRRQRRATRKRKAPNLLRRLRGTKRLRGFRSDC